MDVFECIRAARATRSFSSRGVGDETVERVVGAARRAGSGHNRQPWTFIVIRDRSRLDALAEFGAFTSPLRDAPIGLVLAVDEADSPRRAEHNVFDCGRAAQNLHLAATALGLGIVPQGIRDREDAGRFMGLPAGKRVVMAFALGYPADTPSETIEGVPKDEELDHPGRKPVSAILHRDRHA